MDEGEPRWVDIAISWLLRTGVLVSITVVAVGIVISFTHHPEYFTSRPQLGHLTSAGAHFPHTLSEVVSGIRAGRGQAIVTAGLLLLIATPVARVAFSIVVFAIEHDHLYVVITAVVLIVLMVSFMLGRAGG